MEHDLIEDVVRRNVVSLRRVHLDETRGRQGRPAPGQDRPRPGSGEREWTQEEVAQRLGLARTTYTAIERGERGISISDLLALAYVLDVAPITLLTPPLEDPDTVTVRASGGNAPVLGTVTARRLRDWLVGLQRLPGQDLRFFRRQALRRHTAIAQADARVRGRFGREPQPGPGSRPDELDAAEQYLARMRSALDRDDVEAAEHYAEGVEEAMFMALRRANGETTRDDWLSRAERRERHEDA
ncbi:MAG TPA: helix-turn-helix transcriptional regulator [Mycobacteriales bacterium]|nr:helix-turn-helix transcriptional regulator [Mycobacteriales bacterium]